MIVSNVKGLKKRHGRNCSTIQREKTRLRHSPLSSEKACAYQWKCSHLEGRQVAFWQDDCHCSELAVEHDSDFRAPI